MSQRKPYNINAGYIAGRKFNSAYIVIYNAKEAGMDVGEKKYAVVYETHHRLMGATSVPKSREIMKNPDFCEGCFPDPINPQDCTDRDRDYDPIDLSAEFDI